MDESENWISRRTALKNVAPVDRKNKSPFVLEGKVLDGEAKRR